MYDQNENNQNLDFHYQPDEQQRPQNEGLIPNGPLNDEEMDNFLGGFAINDEQQELNEQADFHLDYVREEDLPWEQNPGNFTPGFVDQWFPIVEGQRLNTTMLYIEGELCRVYYGPKVRAAIRASKMPSELIRTIFSKAEKIYDFDNIVLELSSIEVEAKRAKDLYYACSEKLKNILNFLKNNNFTFNAQGRIEEVPDNILTLAPLIINLSDFKLYLGSARACCKVAMKSWLNIRKNHDLLFENEDKLCLDISSSIGGFFKELQNGVHPKSTSEFLVSENSGLNSLFSSDWENYSGDQVKQTINSFFDVIFGGERGVDLEGLDAQVIEIFNVPKVDESFKILTKNLHRLIVKHPDYKSGESISDFSTSIIEKIYL